MGIPAVKLTSVPMGVAPEVLTYQTEKSITQDVDNDKIIIFKLPYSRIISIIAS